MPTQLDDTWLPPETRIDWDENPECWPFDYGSVINPKFISSGVVFNGRNDEKYNWIYNRYSYSENIWKLIEYYETWASQKRKELQKISDENETITIDELLWFLRYEKRTIVAEILGEKGKHYKKPFINIPYDADKHKDNIGVIPHTLMKAIKKALENLNTVQ